MKIDDEDDSVFPFFLIFLLVITLAGSLLIFK